MPDDTLREFASMLRDAEIDDLGLIARNVFVSRKGCFEKEDKRYIRKNLVRLVPGEGTHTTIERFYASKASYLKLVRVELPEGSCFK